MQASCSDFPPSSLLPKMIFTSTLSIWNGAILVVGSDTVETLHMSNQHTPRGLRQLVPEPKSCNRQEDHPSQILSSSSTSSRLYRLTKYFDI
ncbi:hypothetical protein MRB53_012559 [Persea americana]|uniref:Uncharacterized protein n=1 Tax=Persea americana TaxID=3435 RepID=A0ACC2LXS2_PERAE|nr:hypothetical protein MRB53_012559 [Persea americana]